VPMCDQIITTNKPTPNFLQTACPSYHPTNSVKALKRKISHSRTCSPQAHLGSSSFVTTKGSWLPWLSVTMAIVSSDASTQSQTTHAKNEKNAQRRRKHCALAVLRQTHKQTNPQTDRGAYNTLRSLAWSVITLSSI